MPHFPLQHTRPNNQTCSRSALDWFLHRPLGGGRVAQLGVVTSCCSKENASDAGPIHTTPWSTIDAEFSLFSRSLELPGTIMGVGSSFSRWGQRVVVSGLRFPTLLVLTPATSSGPCAPCWHQDSSIRRTPEYAWYQVCGWQGRHGVACRMGMGPSFSILKSISLG